MVEQRWDKLWCHYFKNQHSDMVFILGTIKVLNRYLCCMKNASNCLQLAPSKLSSAM